MKPAGVNSTTLIAERCATSIRVPGISILAAIAARSTANDIADDVVPGVREEIEEKSAALSSRYSPDVVY
jgi:hypothetical protein